MISTLLIANRGEVAARIARTCARLGVAYVTVYADADRDLTYHDGAVSTVRLDRAGDHLDGDALIRAALKTGCDAVHPGYGFLSENAEFARSVRAAGLVFVGPSRQIIESMAEKSSALRIMDAAGVPVLPGTREATSDVDTLVARVTEIGYPVIVKPAGGGGGKGMSVVRDVTDLRDSLASATRTATAAFADGRLHVERYVEQARHIEVQVFGDEFGDVVHLFDRDCSLQRRHQKVIEEAPAPNIPDHVRQAILDSAVRGAAALKYVGAGTFEFLLVGDEFYFIEMNTRLQVEHTVTEEITGIDLVEWQLRVASGERLPVRQEQITHTGASVQVRMYAEDPFRSFLPCPGDIEVTRWPDVRIERGFDRRTTVTGEFDPMIAKLVATAPTRGQALTAARRACTDLRWTGISTNLGFVARVLDSPAVAAVSHDTSFLDQIDPTEQFADPDLVGALAVVASLTAPDHSTPWSAGAPAGDREWLDPSDRDLGSIDLTVEGRPFSVRVSGYDGDEVHLRADATAPPVICTRTADGSISVGSTSCTVESLGETWQIQAVGVSREVRRAEYRAQGTSAATPEIRTPMPGTIVAVHVKSGASVVEGQLLGVVEAMKMEHELTATHSGIVTVTATEGAVVTTDDPLFLIDDRTTTS